MFRKRKHKPPFAAYAALLFNASLCLAPFIAARALSTAYGERKPLYEASSEALTATRTALENRFQKLAANGQGTPREVWEKYIHDELEAGDMTKARAFLLAAPSMLPGPEAAALKARIGVSDGQGEQARIEAALTLLSEEELASYERHNASIIDRYGLDDSGADKAQLTPAVASGTFVNKAPTAIPVSEEEPAEFNVLGKLGDVSVQAAKWVRDDKVDEFALILQGVGLTLADREAREGASVLLAARRARKLDPKFDLYITRELFEAVQPARVKGQIKTAFMNDAAIGDNDAIVAKAFRDNANQGALANLLADLRIIRDIAHETSPTTSVTSAETAVNILALVKDGTDLSRARLVAQAGGNAVPALTAYDPDGFLDSAKTVITWNNALRLQLAGLGACFALLILISLNVLWRSITRNKPKRRSAVYGLDEVMLES